MRCAFVVALWLLAACSSPPVTPGPCAPAQAVVTPPDNGFGVVGVPLTVKLIAPMFCDNTVDVQAGWLVTGPDNLEVTLDDGPIVRAVTERDSINGMTSHVTFTPHVAGSYHFTTRFQPNLGIIQDDVLVAENHLDAGPAFEAPITNLGTCEQVDVSPQGRLLCLAGGAAVFTSSGVPEQTLATGGFAARAGNTVWVATPDHQVSRWEETDGGFVLSGTTRPDAGLGEPALGLFPTVNAAVLLTTGSQMFRLQWDGAGLQVEQQRAAQVPFPPGTPSNGWSDGAQYAFFVGGSSGNGTSVAASYCPASALPDAGPAPMCTSVSSTSTRQPVAVANEPAGLWTQQTVFSVALRVEAPSIQVLRPEGAHELVPPLSWAPPTRAARWLSSPYLERRNQPDVVMLLRETAGRFELQRFPSGEVQSVNPEWLTLRHPDKVRVYRR